MVARLSVQSLHSVLLMIMHVNCYDCGLCGLLRPVEAWNFEKTKLSIFLHISSSNLLLEHVKTIFFSLSSCRGVKRTSPYSLVLGQVRIRALDLFLIFGE